MNDDDKYREGRPFVTLYEEWRSAYPEPRDPAIEGQLAATYREAWASSDPMEQVHVLSFVFDRKNQEDADLIIDGLRSENARVAREAGVRGMVMRHQRYIEFDRALFRREFRALVRRFPECEGFRPQDFYGHEEGDEDDMDARPFVNLYEDWMADEYPRDPEIERRLAAMYRETWVVGDAIDRSFVLKFLVFHQPRDPAMPVEGRDLLVEGLRTDDSRLAPVAAFAAEFVLDRGADLGSDVRQALESHLERFPDRVSSAESALRKLNERGGQPSS